jgi:hypothetical protein
VGIGPFMVFTTGTHRIGPREERRGSNYSLPIVVGDGVWIGSGVTILPRSYHRFRSGHRGVRAGQSRRSAEHVSWRRSRSGHSTLEYFGPTERHEPPN